jgi:phosphoesterase RecJ-like protein
MNNYNNIHACFEVFKNSQNIIITAHTNPDGDAVGSALALHRFAKNCGKNSKILCDSPLPPNLEFLNNNEYEVYDPTEHAGFIDSADSIYILDLNDSRRLKRLEDVIVKSNKQKVLIDHHLDPQDFANQYFTDTEASSTAELIYKFIKFTNYEFLDKDVALALYVGIMTDSGSFRFPRTDGDLHRITADLIDKGADPVYAYDEVYNQNTLKTTKLLGEALHGLQIYCDDKLCIMTITKSMLKNANATNADLEGFVEKTLTVSGVQIGIMLSEMLDKDEIRMSFRSKGEYSVREIAMEFGGGGHFHASGARCFSCSLDEAKSKVIEYAARQLFKY